MYINQELNFGMQFYYLILYFTSIMSVLRPGFLGLKNTSYRQQLRILLINSFETLYLIYINGFLTFL